MKSDNDLQHQVQEELASVRSGGDDELDVRVLKGIVTLTGALHSDLAKWSAEDAVRRAQGVKGLCNLTMVVPAASSIEPRADIARGWFPE